MTGVWLRGPTAPEQWHECSPPTVNVRKNAETPFMLPAGMDGDVWRCDCGRRWGNVWGLRWSRIYWPWPRKAREPLDNVEL